MRLVFFDDRFHETHGAQENLMLLATLSKEAGNDVVFVTTSAGPLASRAELRGLSVQIVEAPDQLKLFERTAFAGGPRSLLKLGLGLISYNFQLSKALGNTGPDAIVSGAIRPTLLLAVTRFRLRKPILLYAQNSTPMGGAAVVAGALSSRICLISEGARSTFPSWFQKIAKSRFTSISSGRDFDRYDRAAGHEESGLPATEPALGESPELVNVITVSSITRRKGIERLIAALQEIHSDGVNVALTVVGGTVGPDSELYLTELQGLAERFDLPVDFAGWQDDVVPFFQRSDLFAMASEHEGLPGVLLEAMAVGLGCVTTRAGSAGQLVEDCGAGVGVPVGDHHELVSELRRFCRDPLMRHRCGSSGYVEVRARYGLSQFYDKFQSVLVQVAGDARG